MKKCDKCDRVVAARDETQHELWHMLKGEGEPWT